PAPRAPQGPAEIMGSVTTSGFLLACPSGQKREKGEIKWTIGRQEFVINAILRGPFAQTGQMLLECLAITLGEDIGHNVDHLLSFNISQQYGICKTELSLVPIEHMEDDNVVAFEPQMLEGANDRLRLIVKVRNHDND